MSYGKSWLIKITLIVGREQVGAAIYQMLLALKA